MTDVERARNLAALFTYCGAKWREVVPLDLTVHGEEIRVGTAVLRRESSAWRVISNPDERRS